MHSFYFVLDRMVVMIRADFHTRPWGRTKVRRKTTRPEAQNCVVTAGLTAWAAWDAWAYEPEQPWSTHRFKQTSAAAGGAESTLHNVLQNDFTDRC